MYAEVCILMVLELSLLVLMVSPVIVVIIRFHTCINLTGRRHEKHFLFSQKFGSLFQFILLRLWHILYVELVLYLFCCGLIFDIYADPSGFILFPLVVHSFDLVVSSVGILSIRSTRDNSVKAPIEDPMTILQKGYSVTIVLAVLTFTGVIYHL